MQEDNKLSDESLNKSPIENNNKLDAEIINETRNENTHPKNTEEKNKSNDADLKSKPSIENQNTPIEKVQIKPKKELPIEKKPFNEFINEFLIPSLIEEFKIRNRQVLKISLENTSRPITGDKCWIIYCEIKDTCNFWLSFEKEDITSPKSISLCKSNEKPSVLESFLVDEKRITLPLIISRILQRLNGQKLLGAN